MPFLDFQPARGIYVVIVALGTLASLPYYVLKYSIPTARPNPDWNFQQALMNTLARAFIYHQAVLRVHTPLDLKPGALKDRLVVVSPAATHTYLGVLASKSSIQPAKIPAVWYPDAAAAQRSGRVVLHIHGGCFVLLDSRPTDCTFAADTLLKSGMASRVLMVSYRLASNPGGQFPAALQDVLSTYLYLLANGTAAEDIILSGDSAGANIVLGLLRYLGEYRGELGVSMPCAALLWSPWVDLARAREGAKLELHRNAASDYMTSTYVEWGAKAIADGSEIRSPYLTSIGSPFACEAPLWYQIGGAEVLYDEGLRSAEEMRSVSGNIVEIHIEPAANHDLILGGDKTCFTKEAARSARKASDFVKSVC